MSTSATCKSMSSFVISPVLPPNFMAENPPRDRPLKLGILASGSGTNFEAIAEAISTQQLNAQIQVLIYNNPRATVLERAERRNIPAVLLNHRHFKKREDFDRKIVETLRDLDVELVVMAGWMRILTRVLFEGFPNRILNIHPSLLPSFKGAHAVEDALEAKVKITGCTVHFATLEVDSGPILIQAAVPILPGDTAQTLHDRIQEREYEIYPQAIAMAARTLAGFPLP
ncbi:phosphoribosylglycinamide formyltransferase [Phormidium sp. CCY1219]|uniref:phosphoribosylglycinamide formyltransferase n=1 Tax=Phormidium sp. CCY1219 TaxID=2886104 RepID=UPI002D1F5B6F|nr:phosphoribosylglycinamide formyltransferase [Phormidium sp. CCY1219]